VYERKVALLEISNTFHTKQNRLLSAYTGYCFSFGYAVNRKLHAKETHYRDFRDQNDRSFDEVYGTESTYRVNDKSQAIKAGEIIQCSVPIGGILRFVKKGESTRFALNVELKPGIRFEKLPEYGWFSQGFFQGHFGFKIYLHKAKFNRSYRKGSNS
jgi:hypothetical protein